MTAVGAPAAADAHASDIRAWIDTLESGSMSAGAAAFMYLLLGVEGMDATS